MEKNDILILIYNYMIITKNIIINITNRNIKNYKKTISDVKIGKIEIPIELLFKGSHTKIHVKCDFCGKENNIPYRQYLASFKYNYYTCSPKCSYSKNKITNLDKYGVDNPAKSNDIKEKSKITCLEKYGCESYLKTDDIKEKGKITCLEKYGCESHNSSNIVKNNKKKVFFEKYGVENPSQLDEIKNKKIQTSLKNYGVENPGQSIVVKSKMKQSRILNGNQIPDSQLNDFQKYYKKVSCDTYKNKKDLFKNWNGYDYYDNEYILENFELNSNDSNYPTIDHKISVYYGFINNIDSKEISKLENLCITKRYINSKKNKKCFYERKEKN